MTKAELFTGPKDHYFGHDAQLGELVPIDGGYILRARLAYDNKAGRPDKEGCGFWPSQDPRNDGYIGLNPKTGLPYSASTFRRRMAHAKEIMRQWEEGDWWWTGVIVEVCQAPDDPFEPLDVIGDASLWGIECNWPRPNGKLDNSYLYEVANELIDDALRDAKLPGVVKAVLRTRLKHGELSAGIMEDCHG